MNYRAACVLGIVCAALSAGGVQAQSADPSSLVTLPAVVPSAIANAALAGDSVRFAVRTLEGFRLVSNLEGHLDLRAGDPHVLPVTVGLGPRLIAGHHVAGLLMFTAPGVADTVALEVDVTIRRGLLVSLAGEQRTAQGSRLRLQYELTNSGNVADSVTVDLETQLGRVRGGPQTVLLEPFATLRGEFEVDVAQSTMPGPELAVVKATGDSTAGVGSFEVTVGRGEDGFLASLVTVPTRLFLGSSARSGDVGSAFGLQAAGDLRSGLRLSVAAHDSRDATSAFAFRGLQFGPRFRAQLASRSFSTTVGDVSSRTASFAGYRLQGRGGALEIGGGPLRVSAHAARPAGEAGHVVGGHQVAGGLDVRTPHVVLGLRGLHERRDEELVVPAQELRTAYVRLEPAQPSAHSYLLEAGWMAVENRTTGAGNHGPAISGRYSYRNGPTIFDAQLRRRPTVTGIRSAGADELRVGGLTEVADGFGLVGEFSDLRNPAVQLLGIERTQTMEAGLFLRRNVARLEIRGRVRKSTGATAFEDRTIEATGEAAAGPGSIDARLEVGSTRSLGASQPVFRSVAGYNFRGDRGWGRLGFSFRRDALSADDFSLDLTGAYRLSDVVEIHGSVATMLNGIEDAREALVQAGVQFDVRPDLALLVGAETVRTIDDGATHLQVSLGVRKGLPIPVPFPRQRAVQGIIFLDTDGDGLRGPLEPLMDGIRVTMGGQTVTTRRGHFSFPVGARRAPIEVEASSLGDGFIPPAPMGVPGRTELSIPVHQVASLRIEAFLDTNRDGLRGPTEMPLPDLTVEVSAASGAWTVRTSGDGGAELPAIRPGTYTANVDPETLPRRAQPPGLKTVTLSGGETRTLLVAVPSRSITFLGATSGESESIDASPPKADDGGK